MPVRIPVPSRGRLAGGLALAVLALVPLLAPFRPVQAEEARFTVRPEVITPDVPPFTATIIPIGNGTVMTGGGGGFEPAVVRTRIIAEQDSPNRIIASPATISMFDSWPEGVFDGAEAEVLRIVNGAFASVRKDRVALFHSSGWGDLLHGNQLPPSDRPQYELTWDGFNRLDTPWYFTVRAIDRRGNLSPPARAVAMQPPAQPGAVTTEQPMEPRKPGGQDAAGLAAPENLQAALTLARTVLLKWDPVPGAAGYVVYRADQPPERQRGYAVELEGQGTPIRKGDMVILRKKFLNPTREQVSTYRLWDTGTAEYIFGNNLLNVFPGDPKRPTFRLEPHAPDTPVPEPGETYLHVELFRGQEMRIGQVSIGGSGQSYYAVLEPGKTYRFEAWMRAQGSIQATVLGASGGEVALRGVPAAIQLGTEWKKYTVDFEPDGLNPDRWPIWFGLQLAGVGQVDVDNLRIYRADAPFMDLLPEERAELAASGMSALRTHQFIKTQTGTYDLNQLTSPAGVMPRANGDSLPQVLGIIDSLDMDPWLQIEPHFSRDEWLGLAEYLAAPFDPATDDPKALPWAARRVAQGRAAPWTEAFDRIWFELGNETWNPMFYPWTFQDMPESTQPDHIYGGGQVYGMYQEYVLSILRESPWWDRIAPHLEPVLGGWGINDYGLQALAASPGSTVLGHATYIGGWDTGQQAVRRTPEGYSSVMVYAPQEMAPRGEYFRDAVRRYLPDRKVTLGTYESGPGYTLNGLNGHSVTPEQRIEQAEVMKSAASGAATLDSFLARASVGDRIQNFFLYGHGEEWRSHAVWSQGGQAYPAWDWLTLFNRVGTGDMLAVDTLEVPRMDVPEMGYRPAGRNLPMAAAYATRQGDRLTVTVVSRLVPDFPAGSDGKLSVRVDLPMLEGATRLTRYRADGGFMAENTTAQNTRILSETLDLPADPALLEIPEMPPAAAYVYVFEGVRFRDPG